VRVVVEQNLSTKTIFFLLVAIAIVEPVTVFTIVLLNHASALGLIVASLVTLLLWSVSSLAIRVVVRVVRDVPDEPVFEVVYGASWHITQRFSKSQIESVREVDINPLMSGGWGYRGSLRLIKQASLITRRGPGIELGLIGNRHFRVTVDNPRQFVDALES